MLTKVCFYWPKDYRSGKTHFKDVLIFTEIVTATSGSPINNVFNSTALGKSMLEGSECHFYWKGIETNVVYDTIPVMMLPIVVKIIACPAIDVIVSSDSVSLPDKEIESYHLKYFLIPTYKQLKLDLDRQFKIQYNVPDLSRIHEKIFEEDGRDERKIISL